jgi:MATE family multidrug resistance protein
MEKNASINVITDESKQPTSGYQLMREEDEKRPPEEIDQNDDRQSDNESTSLLHKGRITFWRAFKQATSLASFISLSHGMHIGLAVLGVRILSRYSEDSLAASAPIEAFYGFALNGCMSSFSILHYFIAITEQALLKAKAENDAGAESRESANVGKVFRAGYLYAATLASLLTVALGVGVRPVLRVFGQSDVVVEISGEYYDNLIIGITPIAGMLANREFLNGLKMPHQALTLSSINLAIAGGLGYHLAINENRGAGGLALGNSIGAWVTFLLGLGYFKFSKRFEEFGIFDKDTLSECWKGYNEIARSGLPFIGMAIIDYASIMSMTMLVGRQDDRNLISQSVINQLYLIALAKSLGLVDATYHLIGRAIKSKDTQAIKHYAFATFILSAAVGVGWSLALNLAPRQLMSLFFDVENPDHQSIVETFEATAFITGFKVIVEAMVLWLKGVLVGFNDLPSTAKISFLSLICFGLPFMIGLSLDQDLDPDDINLTRGSSVFLSMLLLAVRCIDQYPQVIDHIESPIQSLSLDTDETPPSGCARRAIRTVSSFFGPSYKERITPEVDAAVDSNIDSDKERITPEVDADIDETPTYGCLHRITRMISSFWGRSNDDRTTAPEMDDIEGNDVGDELTHILRT